MKWWRANGGGPRCSLNTAPAAPAPGYRSCDACRARARAYSRGLRALRAELAARKAAGGGDVTNAEREARLRAGHYDRPCAGHAWCGNTVVVTTTWPSRRLCAGCEERLAEWWCGVARPGWDKNVMHEGPEVEAALARIFGPAEAP